MSYSLHKYIHHQNPDITTNPENKAMPWYDRSGTWCNNGHQPTLCNHAFGKIPDGTASGIPAGFYSWNRSARKRWVDNTQSPAYKQFYENIKQHVIDKHDVKECPRCGSLIKNLKTHQRSTNCVVAERQRKMESDGYTEVYSCLQVFLVLMEEATQARLAEITDGDDFTRLHEELDTEKKAFLKKLEVRYAVSDYDRTHNSQHRVVGWVWKPWVPLDIADAMLYLHNKLCERRRIIDKTDYLTELKTWLDLPQDQRESAMGLWELADAPID